MINYTYYYLLYRYLKNSEEIKYYAYIHNKLVRLVSLETILKSNKSITQDNNILSNLDQFNYCSYIKINKGKKLNTFTGRIFSILYIIIFIFTVFCTY